MVVRARSGLIVFDEFRASAQRRRERPESSQATIPHLPARLKLWDACGLAQGRISASPTRQEYDV
jgi:hypothetical protein